MTANELWKKYASLEGVEAVWEAWSFGNDPDAVAALVRDGIKTATSSAYDLYALEEEPLPKVGDYSVILDSAGNAVCIIRDTNVYVVPFDQVSERHAFLEGEGDRSLACWRQVHEAFFRDELAAAGLQFHLQIPVLCEEFEVVHLPKIP